jgi:lysophospholipase L1-like esterase
MKRLPKTIGLLSGLTALLLSASARATEPIAGTSSETAKLPEKERPDVATMRLDKTGKPSAAFLAAHEAFLKRARQGPIGLLFIGDSITAGWASVGKEVWAKSYAAYSPANFGMGGDRTQHVLWRIEHGELDGITPAVVVLLIGVNNGGDSGVTAGVKKVVAAIHARLPESKVLLLGIFPHGADPLNPPWIKRSREFIAQVNKELATLDDGKKTRFLDIGDQFLDTERFIRPEIMPDGLHPAAPGYQIWADAMRPLLREMLGEGS